VTLDDDDPLWKQHSGRQMHRGAEWGNGDRALAEEFYTALPTNTKFVFDLLMDHPGDRLTSDWIAAQMSRRRPSGARPAGRRSVSSSLSPVARPHAKSGRRLPFYWWQGNGEASLYAMKPSVAKLFREARENTDGNEADQGSAEWSTAEVAAVVGDYLAMLQAELTGEPYSKAGYRRALLPALNPVRTPAAVEYKHQNISATMLALGLPYIRGYKPMSNYQAAVTAEIQRRLEADPHLLRTLQDGASAGAPPTSRLQRTPAPAPAPTSAPPPAATRKGRHVDYGLLQEENRRRGRQGENLVVDYERAWLRQHDRPHLAGRVRWTARDDGDGLRYDVLSFDLGGQERYIEVKTTALGTETPFYITSAELDFAQRNAEHYALYRVYDVLGEPRFFALEGDITEALALTPATYSAQIAATMSASGLLTGAATEPAHYQTAAQAEK
jgi:Family of unknown function (DUF6416)/Domain of unknown function (DUF3883)